MKTLSPSLTLILLSILALTSFLPLTSCSDTVHLEGCVESEGPYYKLSVTGKMCDYKLPGFYVDDSDKEFPVFLVSDWHALDTDSDSESAYSALADILDDGRRELCILMPEDFEAPGGEGIEFLMNVNVEGMRLNKERYDLRFIDFVDSETTLHTDLCATVSPEVPIVYPYSRGFDISDKVVNVYVHIVRSTSGVGLNKETSAKNIQLYLSSYFKDTHLEFNMIGSDYIDIMTDSWLQNLSFVNESDKKKITSYNSHTDAIDIYIVSEFDSEVAGVAMGIPATALILKGKNLHATTIPHEMGHCLGLYHTHQYTSTLSIFNDLSERVDGSNSAVAGDLVVDTPADPNKWNGGVYSGGNLVDANGQRYNPDPRNLMSYSGILREYFSEGQTERMHMALAVEPVLSSVIAKKTLPSPFHFSGNRTIEISGIASTDRVDWKIGRTTNSSSALTYTTSTERSITLNSSKSEYFTISATVTGSQGAATQLYAQATSGAPSPAIGTLAWSVGLNGQSGATNAQNFGSPLGISGTTNVRLEYLDPASANIPGISFTCVTAANRVLRGTTFQLTQADCANGFLKIRASDNCGTSDDYFTIMTEVSGSYYAVNVDNGTLTFEGRAGNASSTTATAPLKAPAKAPVICSIQIFDSNGRLVLAREADSVSSLSIPSGSLSSGDYKAIVSDGTDSREVLFAI